MLPIFMEQFMKAYPGIPVELGNCIHDPVQDAMGLSQVFVDWKEKPALSLMRAMLSLCLDYDADYAIKLDVDCWHRSDFLTPVMQDHTIMAAGIQWLDNPHNFLGLAYAVRRSALVALECEQSCSAWNGGEDRAMSWMLRKLYPNQIHLMKPTTARRADTDDGTASIVHCGCFYSKKNPRDHATQAMINLYAASS
jgi:hypothetical protein